MKTKLELGFMRHDINSCEISQSMVDYAMLHSQPYFETCYFYLDYKCEDFIYSLLTNYSRETYELCGKAPIHNIVEKNGIKKIFEEQISKVPGGYFDIYLLQALDSSAYIILKEQNVIQYLLKQKQAGKIKRLGISIQCTPETFKKYLQLKCWDIVQMPLNYYDWFCCRGNELYQLAKAYEIPIIAQAPMKGGLLRNANIENPEKFAIDFVRALEPEYILTGSSTISSYINTFLQLNEPLELIDFAKYKSVLQEYLDKTEIQCVNCNRCSHVCKQNIPIAALFKMYNKLLNLDLPNRNYIFNDFNDIKKSIGEPVHTCIQCKNCEEVCPQYNHITTIFKNNIFEMRT